MAEPNFFEQMSIEELQAEIKRRRENNIRFDIIPNPTTSDMSGMIPDQTLTVGGRELSSILELLAYKKERAGFFQRARARFGSQRARASGSFVGGGRPRAARQPQPLVQSQILRAGRVLAVGG